MNFRDYRDIQHVPGDRYQAGRLGNPYHPQFTLTDVEKIGSKKITNSKRETTSRRKNYRLGEIHETQRRT